MFCEKIAKSSQEMCNHLFGHIFISQPSGKMVAAAKAAVPTVTDQAAALQLGNFAKATGVALADLRAASARVGVVWECVMWVWACVLVLWS